MATPAYAQQGYVGVGGSNSGTCPKGQVALINMEPLPIVVAIVNVDVKSAEKIVKTMGLKNGRDWKKGHYTPDGQPDRDVVLFMIPARGQGGTYCAPLLGEQWMPIQYIATAFQGVGDMPNSKDPSGEVFSYDRKPWSLYRSGRWVFTLDPKSIR